MTALDLRAARLRDALLALLPAHARPAAEVDAGDPLAQAEACARALARLQPPGGRSWEEVERRLLEISDVIVALVAFDYQTKASVLDDGDLLDGISAGLNMLGEELAETTISRSFVHNVLASMSDLLLVADREGRISLVNRAACEITGHPAEALVGQPLAQLLPDLPLAAALGSAGVLELERDLLTRAGARVPVSVALSRLREKGAIEGLVCVARDLSEHRRAEAERMRLREAVQRQEIALEELSTPILALTPELVLLPLIGSLDAARARQMTEALLAAVVARRARTAIVDITGARAIGPEAIAGLLQAVHAVRLVGAEVLLTGVRPELACALAEQALDLRGLRTFSELGRGLAHALGRGR